MLRFASGMMVAAVVAASAPALAQTPDAFELLRDWEPDEATSAEPTQDTLLLKAGAIWSAKAYTDFVLRFEYRPVAGAGGGNLLLRASVGASRDVHAYEVALDRRPERGRLSARRQVLHEVAFTPSPPIVDSAAWTAVEVRAQDDVLEVSLDGVVVSRADRTESIFGSIGFRAGRGGGLELRGLRIRALAVERTTVGTGLPKAEDRGISRPKAVRRAQPQYTRGALVARAQGVAVVEFVIDATGAVGEAKVVRAPHPDLAVSSLACVRKWRFTPAPKDGAPVAVVATMELAFNLSASAEPAR